MDEAGEVGREHTRSRIKCFEEHMMLLKGRL
jgi:hypothetical protein